MASSPPSPQLPPLLHDHTFAVSGSSVIDAPQEKVWSILLDFKEYRRWNPFVRNQTPTDANQTPLTPTSELTVGTHILISPVHLPPTMAPTSSLPPWSKSSAFCVVSHLDPATFRIAWRTAGKMPGWLLRTERWQWLTEVDADVGEGKDRKRRTKYDSVEVFDGILAWFVKWFVGGNLKKGFQAQADGLKKWAEKSV